MKIIALESSEWEEAGDHGVSRDEITTVLTAVGEEVGKILELPEHLNITVRPNSHSYHLIPQTGDGARTVDTELVEYVFDPKLPYGKEALLRTLRESIFHELNHVYRWMESEYDGHILNSAVFEGSATVFETDYAGASPLWGKYDGEPMDDWLKELATKSSRDYSDYFFDHPDGRKWIGYKVGTWLVREAMKNSGKGVVDLTRTPWREMVELAGKGSLIEV